MAAALIATNKFGSRSNSILNCVPIFFNAPFQFQMGDYLVVVFIVADVFGKIFLSAVNFFEANSFERLWEV